MGFSLSRHAVSFDFGIMGQFGNSDEKFYSTIVARYYFFQFNQIA